jgi:hypothetical protein
MQDAYCFLFTSSVLAYAFFSYYGNERPLVTSVSASLHNFGTSHQICVKLIVNIKLLEITYHSQFLNSYRK